LVLETTIALPDTPGRIDHMAVDLGRKHLFVAEVGNNTLDVIDLNQRKPIKRISGLKDPQGVAYLPGPDLFVVANGSDGAVRFYSGADFAARGVVNLGDDADNVRVDPRNGEVLVGYGDGGLAVIDPASQKKLVDIPLAAHPESFRFSAATGRAFVNLPGAGRIASVDLDRKKVVAEWRTPGLIANYPMALDESGHAVLVVFRGPSKLAAFDTTSGMMTASVPSCGDSDDLFLDEKRRLIYVSCGDGTLDVFRREGLARIAHIATSSGARTSLFVPELDRLFVAVRAGLFGGKAEIRVYRPAP
jgi:DNA-binding beta-propeller fold protein YncE